MLFGSGSGFHRDVCLFSGGAHRRRPTPCSGRCWSWSHRCAVEALLVGELRTSCDLQCRNELVAKTKCCKHRIWYVQLIQTFKSHVYIVLPKVALLTPQITLFRIDQLAFK
jgi:hypothetical protein